MPDLDFRFDDITEKYSSRQLEEIREFASTHVLPDELIIEVGSNRGRFIRQLALERPHAEILGIELRYKWVKAAREDLEAEGIDNAHVLCADVNLVMPILVDDGQLTDLFLLYPDPWWKKKHRKRRVIQPEFLDLLATKMPPGGNLWIRTDVGPLADDMRDTIIVHSAFEPIPPDEYPLEPFLRSTRERTTIRKGMPVNLVYFRRTTL